MTTTKASQITQETTDLLSNPKFVISLIKKSKASHRWLDRHCAELEEKYPDQ